MIKELKDGMYIDAWWDRFSRNYIIQVKDENGYEIENEYVGDMKSRDFVINAFTEKYLDSDEEINEGVELVQVGDGYYNGEQPWEKFQQDVKNNYGDNVKIQRIKTDKPNVKNYKVYDDAYDEKIEEGLLGDLGNKQKKKTKRTKLPALDTLHPTQILPDKEKGIAKFNELNGTSTDSSTSSSGGESSGGMGESIENKKEENNTMYRNFYVNELQESYDIIDDKAETTTLNESLKVNNIREYKSLREGLRDYDIRAFEEFCETPELEMLYESVASSFTKDETDNLKKMLSNTNTTPQMVSDFITGVKYRHQKGLKEDTDFMPYGQYMSYDNKLYDVKMMHEIMRNMNDENAYMTWIYVMPDEPDDVDFENFAEDEEEYDNLCDTFDRLFQRYKKHGIVDETPQMTEWLRVMGYIE